MNKEKEEEEDLFIGVKCLNVGVVFGELGMRCCCSKEFFGRNDMKTELCCPLCVLLACKTGITVESWSVGFHVVDTTEAPESAARSK
jgi:hypothetical protein